MADGPKKVLTQREQMVEEALSHLYAEVSQGDYIYTVTHHHTPATAHVSFYCLSRNPINHNQRVLLNITAEVGVLLRQSQSTTHRGLKLNGPYGISSNPAEDATLMLGRILFPQSDGVRHQSL